MNAVLAETVFTPERVSGFAALSGDRNPIHVDPVAARRLVAGEPLVHGVLQLLWALETHFATAAPAPPAGLRVAFEKPLPVGAPARLVRLDRGDRLVLELHGPSGVGMRATLDRSAPAHPPHPPVGGPLFAPHQPAARSEADLDGLSGAVPLVDPAAAAAAFPACAAAIGAGRVAGLLAATFLVGMVAPGLRSLFRGLALALVPLDGGGVLSFATTVWDPRFALLRLAVAGAGWCGTLDAHLRPEPVAQPGARAVAARVCAAEFAGRRALVVGGSRGLGEVAVDILAAGGAQVVATWARGRADAERVRADVAAVGGHCTVARFDVTDGADGLVGVLAEPFDLLVYTATPPIRRAGTHDPAALSAYLAVYVDAFAAVAERLAARAIRPLGVFWPSSVHVEAPPDGFVDYAMAKAAGEVLCASLRRDRRFGAVVADRLPRLATDQTAGLAAETFPDPVDLLLDALRRAAAGRGGA